MFNNIDWTIYNTLNSGIPSNSINTIAIDNNGNKWIGTGAGLVKYNNGNWTVYNSSNSGIPGNSISSISIDTKGNKWIGMYWGGIAKFDGTNWVVYNGSNSSLLTSTTRTITTNKEDKWIGTNSGLINLTELIGRLILIQYLVYRRVMSLR